MNEAKISISALNRVSSDFGNVLFRFFLVGFEVSYTRANTVQLSDCITLGLAS